MYSVLGYIIELSQYASDLAFQNNLTKTYEGLNNLMSSVNGRREQLSAFTGQSEEDFFNDILANDSSYQQAQQEAEAAQRLAEEQARQAAARQAAEELARQQAAAAEAARLAEELARQQAAADEQARRLAEEQAQADEAARAAAEAAAKAAAEAQANAIAIAKQEGAGTTGRAIADYAETFIGVLPYVWGGASLTAGADCSGFVGQILAHFGILDQGQANRHAYSSWTYRDMGAVVSEADIRPGDVICYNGHVAIYFGNNMVVHEPNTGRKAEYGNLYMMPIICIRRFV